MKSKKSPGRRFFGRVDIMVDKKDRSITVVGAGIVGLLSAYFLHRAGFKVSIIDAGPNPLSHYDRNKVGATYSGGNARHVSATETSPHASSSMGGQIYKSVNEGGWLAKDPNLLTSEEKTWMQNFDRLTKTPEFLSSFTKIVIRVNNLGKDLWRELMREDPDLFESVGVQEHITVFFLDTPTFESETIVETQANQMFPVKILSSEEIARNYPTMADSVSRRMIAGGLILDGFSLHVISFCKNVIKRLENQAVDFSWNSNVTDLYQIEKSTDYYLISTGVSLSKKVMGVAGVWITIPNPGLKGPIKIATPYPTGYINGTLEGGSLLLSGGYGFIGRDSCDEKSHWIQTLFEDMRRNIQMVFPESYKRACKEGTLDERVCVRPMKASGLGVFDVIDQESSKVILAGANNAGGFTQAPVVAKSFLEIINGKEPFLRKEYSSDIDFLDNRS